MVVESLGERLRRLRVGLGKSQRAIAAGLSEVGGRGVTAAYVSRIEAGERVPSIGAIIALAGNLPGVTGLEILTGDRAAPCPLCRRSRRPHFVHEPVSQEAVVEAARALLLGLLEGERLGVSCVSTGGGKDGAV